ncbi:MAG: hypothetical protein U9O18_00510 [Chloroflexota bacterium]|nr:hypothetical protein [Chloroflexota bacterium]
METQQIIQSLSYVTWVLLGALALGSFALTWLLRQTTDASTGFLGFSAILAAVIGLGWLMVEWGLPPPTELPIEDGADFDELRRAAIASFSVLALVAGIRLRRGGRAPWLGSGAILAGVAAMASGAWGWSGAEPIGVSLLVQLLALSAITGGSMAAVVLAHWYLVTPKISEEPLVLTTKLLMLVLLLQLLLFGVWAAAGIPGMEPFEVLTGPNMVFVWLRLVIGLVFPLLLSWMAYRTALTRSMESATGLLYIEFALVMASTIVAAGLLFGEGLLV